MSTLMSDTRVDLKIFDLIIYTHVIKLMKQIKNALSPGLLTNVYNQK